MSFGCTVELLCCGESVNPFGTGICFTCLVPWRCTWDVLCADYCDSAHV